MHDEDGGRGASGRCISKAGKKTVTVADDSIYQPYSYPEVLHTTVVHSGWSWGVHGVVCPYT
jgi:hypothetical protein